MTREEKSVKKAPLGVFLAVKTLVPLRESQRLGLELQGKYKKATGNTKWNTL